MALPQETKQAMDATIGKLKAKSHEWKYETSVESKVALARACLARLATLRRGGDEWVKGSLAVEGLAEEVACEKRFALIALVPILRSIVNALLDKNVPKVTWETKSVRVYETGILDYTFSLQKELWADPTIHRVWGFDDSDKEEEKKGRVCLVLGAGNVDSRPMRDVMDRLFLHGDVVLLKHHSVRWFLHDAVEYVLGPLLDAGVLCHVPDQGLEYAKALVQHPDIGHVHLTGGLDTHSAIRKALNACGKKDSTMLTSELGCATPWIVFPNPPKPPAPTPTTKTAETKRGPPPKKEWNMESLWFYARQIAAAKTLNGGALCVSPQVLVLPSAWEYKDTFLGLLRQAFEKNKGRPSYYPHSLERATATADALQSSSAKSVERIRPQQFSTPPQVVKKLNAHVSAAGHSTQAKFYNVAIVHLGEVPKERKEWTAWSSRYKSVLQEEVFGPLLAVVEVPSWSSSSSSDVDAKKAYKQTLRDTIDFCNDQLFGSLSTTLLVPETVDTDFVNECVERLHYGAVGINLWSLLVYAVAEGGWGAYPGMYAPNDAGSGNCQVGNPFQIPGLRTTVLRGPFHNPLLDVGKPIPPIVADVLGQLTCRRDYGLFIAILAALWSILTYPFRPFLT